MLAGKHIKRNIWRHYFSRVFTTYYANLLNLHNYDTQCGLKIFHHSIIPILYEETFLSKWLFDLELFLRIKKHLGEKEYFNKVHEVPLNQWVEIPGSKLKFSDFFKAPFEVLKIRKHYK